MPLDHQLLPVPSEKVGDLAAWLITSMDHLGFKEVKRFGDHVIGMGEGPGAYFWLVGEDEKTQDAKTMEAHFRKHHICFSCETEDQVKQFYEAAIKAGGTDNGAPGPRPQYGEKYYGAFVRDPYVNINWEVVTNAKNL